MTKSRGRRRRGRGRNHQDVHRGAQNAPANASVALPTATSTQIYRYLPWATPTTTSSGGTFLLTLDGISSYPGLYDTHALKGTGFKVTDYLPASVWADYDYFRVKSVTYYATWLNPVQQVDYSISNAPEPDGVCSGVEVWYSVDFDDGTNPGSVDTFFRRQNKEFKFLTPMAPMKKLLSYHPRRRISTNADPSLQVVTSPDEWCDVAYVNSLIFGNLKICAICPGGRIGYVKRIEQGVTSPSSFAHVKINSHVEIEALGKR